MKKHPNLIDNRPFLVRVAAVLILLVCGAAAIWWQVTIADREMRIALLRRTRLLAESIDPDQLEAIIARKCDPADPLLRQLKEQLIILKKINPDLRFIYLMASREDGQILLLLDSEPPDSPDYIPPGFAYDDIPDALREGIVEQKEVVAGPLRDRWGQWMSGCVPIRSPATGNFLAGLAADIDAGQWSHALLLAALPGAFTTLIMIVVVLIGLQLLARRSRLGPAAPKWFNHLEPGLVVVFGVILSLFVAWYSWRQERTRCRQTFAVLAGEQTRDAVSTIKLIEIKLNTLAKFVSSRDNLTRQEFQYYCEALTGNPLVWGWGWFPRVPADRKAAFETEAEADVEPGYRIWEKSSDGKRQPASPRDVYYPARFATPTSGGKIARGFDLGSEFRRRTAIERAFRTGLLTATDPVKLNVAEKEPTGILIFQPLFHPRDGAPTGLVAALVLADAIFSPYRHFQETFDTSLVIYQADGSPEVLAASSLEETVPHTMQKFVRPILAFGKVFALDVRPGPEYLRNCTASRYLVKTALLGGAFTIALAVIVGLICRWRAELQRLVRKRTAELNQSEQRFSMLARQSRTVLWEVDASGLYTYLSPVCEDVYGYSPEELVHRMYYYDIHPEAGRERFKTETAKHLAEKRNFVDYINPIQTKSGAIIQVASNGAPVLDKNGNLLGYQGYDKDVTEREQVNAELRRSRRAAESANRAKTEFLAHMSHEIRTPLNGMIGVTDLLNGTRLDEEQRHLVGIIGSNGKLLLALINDILDFSRIEAGKIELDPVDFDLDDFLSELSAALAYQAHQKGLALILSIAENVPVRLHGDNLRLREILINLAGNAIKFTERGKVEIDVTVLHEAEKTVELRFAVRDTGIGIAKTQSRFLFDAFFQGDSSIKRKYGGTGLGLAISKQLATYMGGKLSFSSEEGRGSEFRLTVSFGKVTGHADPPVLSEAWNGARVLIVEDNISVREILARYLTELSLRPVGVSDCSEAVQLINREPPESEPFRIVFADRGQKAPGIAALEQMLMPHTATGPILLFALIPLGYRWNIHARSKLRWAGQLDKPFTRKCVRNLVREHAGNPVVSADKTYPLVRVPAPIVHADITDVLLVEDNPTNQLVAQLMLKKLGLRVDVAGNGLVALKMLAETPYRIVLMDVQMPELDGIETTRRIRAPESTALNPRVPVIAITAHALMEYQKLCREAGMDDYITKPITLTQLRDMAARWLPKRPDGGK